MRKDGNDGLVNDEKEDDEMIDNNGRSQAMRNLNGSVGRIR